MYLFLQFVDNLHTLTIKFHWFYFHYNLDNMMSTCLALSTNLSVFIVSSMLLIDGDIFPTMKVKVFPVSES